MATIFRGKTFSRVCYNSNALVAIGHFPIDWIPEFIKIDSCSRAPTHEMISHAKYNFV